MATVVRVTAAQATAKWLSRLSAATQEITDGVNRVTVAPGTLAAAKADKWIQGIQAAQAKWKTNVAAVTLEQWKSSMTQYGINRIASGAQAKQHKVEAFMTQFLPYLNAGLQTIHNMPDTTPEQRINKMVAMVQYTAKFKRNPSGA